MRDTRTWALLLALAAGAGAVAMSISRSAEATPTMMAADAAAATNPTAEANARRLMKATSDYMAAQKALSFTYNTNLEVVTEQDQKIALASSGAMTVNRPNKIRAARNGGFANIEFVFDGQKVTLFGKEIKAYAQVDAPGTIDQLVDVLRDKYHRPVPGADLLMSNVYDALMPEVIDVKDLGSGVINGIECDHLAFRTKEVDWQIWIAQGDRPYPCRYTITSTKVKGNPQYSIEIADWKTGAAVAPDQFAFNVPAGARKLAPGELADFDELPTLFTIKKKVTGGR